MEKFLKITVVTTTINLPTFLKAYSEDAIKFNHDVNFIVIGDRKSPKETADFCSTIANCVYMDIESQREYMLRFPELWAHLPFDSVERRMIGILRAYETGCDVMVTIDDDNLLATENVFAWHGGAGFKLDLPTFRSTSGWFNVCSFLEEENNVKFYHRGYSPRNKWKDGYNCPVFSKRKVIVNAGLWYNDPDTDAITRLERPLNVTGFETENSECGLIALAPGTWSPFNCQNTAIAREAIPAYFMSPFIGRHADIFASYVITRLAEHFNDVIAFGMPLANHARTPHNLWNDLEIEKWGMQNTDFFCDMLRNIKLTASTYHEAFGEIIEQLNVRWPTASKFGIGDTEAGEMIEGMQIWHNIFKRIL
jgi:hypothetical protein